VLKVLKELEVLERKVHRVLKVLVDHRVLKEPVDHRVLKGLLVRAHVTHT
jgi:hypothetical protein